MDTFRQYSLVIGLSILIGVVALLLSSSDLIFSSGVSFISTELHQSSGDEAYVQTRIDFGSQEHMDTFPLQVGEWSGRDEGGTEWWEERLGADVALLRAYVTPGVYQPLFLLVMQAQTGSSFHAPRTCYSAQGYEIQEDEKEQIEVTDASWAKGYSHISIPVDKLVVVKESNGKIVDRRVVLYFYVKGNQYKSDTITMIRMEANVPVEGSYEAILNMEKEFLAQAVPLMFIPDEDEWNTIASQLAKWGIGGYFLIALMLFIPLAIIIYPKTKWGRDSTVKSGLKENET